MPRRNSQSYGELSSQSHTCLLVSVKQFTARFCLLSFRQVASSDSIKTRDISHFFFLIFLDGLYGTFCQWELNLSCCSKSYSFGDSIRSLGYSRVSRLTHKSQISAILFMMFHFFVFALFQSVTFRINSNCEPVARLTGIFRSDRKKKCGWQWTCSICNEHGQWTQLHGIQNYAYRI